MIKIIAAVSENGIIGDKGELPWSCPEDLYHFQRTTKGGTIVVGSRTYFGMGRLRDRINVVCSRQGGHFPEALRVTDLRSFLEICPDCWVIGGQQIYEQALPFAEKCLISRIPGTFKGDATFPVLGSDWALSKTQPHATFTLEIWDRVHPGDS